MLGTIRRNALWGVVLSGVAALLFAASPASAATVDLEASAAIVHPIAIDVDKSRLGMNFGRIIPGSEESEVEVTPSNERNVVSGDATFVDDYYYNIQIWLNGPPFYTTYDLELPETVTLETHDGATMEATLSHNSDGVINEGTDFFGIGGTLTIKPNQEQGEYGADFNLTISYP